MELTREQKDHIDEMLLRAASSKIESGFRRGMAAIAYDLLYHRIQADKDLKIAILENELKETKLKCSDAETEMEKFALKYSKEYGRAENLKVQLDKEKKSRKHLLRAPSEEEYEAHYETAIEGFTRLALITFLRNRLETSLRDDAETVSSEKIDDPRDGMKDEISDEVFQNWTDVADAGIRFAEAIIQIIGER